MDKKCTGCGTIGSLLHGGLCAGCDSAKETKRLRTSTISDCILGILESLKIDQKQLDKILNDISNIYDSMVLDWIRDNITVSGPISDLSLEWK